MAEPPAPEEFSEVQEYIGAVAPADVRRTLSWLKANGWVVVGARGGRSESFGNALIDLARHDNRVTITLDRSQWFLDLRPGGGKDSFDLGILLDAMAGRTSWKSERGMASQAGQIPTGISWAEVVPGVLDWVASTPDLAATLRKLQLKRSRDLLPSAKRSRTE